ncbi:MAG: hypothetical protein K6F32_06540 [Bacilli bacterium]|nr:hypothetical protein [Bacilli bacterium]
MRTITIFRREGPLGGRIDATILSSEKELGVFKAEDEKVVYELCKGEHSIQAQVIDEGGKVFRSNVYFLTGGKSKNLYLTISGYKLTLRSEDAKK